VDGGDRRGIGNSAATVAVFPSADLAQKFFSSSSRLFPSVTKTAEIQRLSVKRDGDLLTISMGSNSGLVRAHACQQALGARDNVIVETRTCEVSPSAINIPQQRPATLTGGGVPGAV
jgi:hypothetical protein